MTKRVLSVDPTVHRVTINKKRKTLLAWSKELGLTPVAVYNRLSAVDKEGNFTWTVKDAYTKPRKGGRTQVNSTQREHQYRLEFNGNLISTHYRKGHAQTVLERDGRPGLQIVTIPKIIDTESTGFRISVIDKKEIMQAAKDANMSFSLFIVTACLDAAREGTYLYE